MATRFIKSATNLDQCPLTELPEVAVVGRSNVGKSSLLNAWFGQKLVKTSQTPGKTQLLNFFQIDSNYLMADLPGYGYARLPQETKKLWTPMIEGYLRGRENLRTVLLIVDARRDWSPDEENLVNWLQDTDRPVWLILNKVDQLNQKERAAREKAYSIVTRRIKSFWVSAKTGSGIDQLRRSVFENLLIRPQRQNDG